MNSKLHFNQYLIARYSVNQAHNSPLLMRQSCQ